MSLPASGNGEGHAAQSGTGVEGSVARVAGISYLHIPARDPSRAAAFYSAVFGWSVTDDPAHASFRDGTGHVIGHWITDRPAAGDTGVLPYVYVDRVDDTLAAATANGAEVVKPVYPEGDLWVATFRDPEGNVIGVWQQGPR